MTRSLAVLVLYCVQLSRGNLELLSKSSPLSCIQIISASSDYKTLFKMSKKFINIARNESYLMETILGSSPCLLYTVNPSNITQTWLASLQRHLIVTEGVRCQDLLASQFNIDMYCIEDDDIYEKYSIRGIIVFKKVSTLKTEKPLFIYNKKLERRSDLQGVELTVTALSHERNIENLVYGPYGTAKVEGFLGDLFMTMQKRMNFTFSLRRPDDNKWGGKEEGRKYGWNGMVGDIAEGKADFGIGPFTSTPQRNEVVRFSIGNLDVAKTFFFRRSKSDVLNFTLFIAPFTLTTWLAILFLILCVSSILSLIVHMVKDKESAYFNLIRSLVFSFSGVTFVRRWSVTPESVSARIVFIIVLYVGIIIQGMWKAAFTSVLAVEKEIVLYEDLEDLLKAEMTIAVEKSSAQEGNFR